MFKKSLFLGSVTLVLLALIALAGCSNPAVDGAPGERGPLVAPTAAVSDTGLAELFTANNTVRLKTGNGTDASVYGIVPVGKTLEIAGSVNIGTGVGETLDVQGTLRILENGELFPTAGSVLLLDRSASVVVEGFIYEELAFFPPKGGLDPRVTFAPSGGVTLGAGSDEDDVDYYFGFPQIYRVKWNSTTPDLEALEKWTPGKTLVLNADNTPTPALATDTTIDISEKGDLIIAATLEPDGTWTGVTTTVGNGKTLKANAGRNQVTVAETGILEFGDNASTLAGRFKVNGTLSAGNFTTTVIPATVDLSEGTLAASADTAKFQFPAGADKAKVNIKKIDVTFSLAVTNTDGLFVKLIEVNDTKTLQLPNNVDTVVERIDTRGLDISIKGEDTADASYAWLKPASIYGGITTTGVTLDGNNIKIADTVKLASDTVITAATLSPFGVDAAQQHAQLAKIEGGAVNFASGVVINAPTVLNTTLVSTGTITFNANTTLNAGAVVAANTGEFIIGNGAKLTIGPYGSIDVGTKLLVGPGVYTA
ncbi:MAG: hypothetical protein LBC60_06000, partial [Spirochaetaceae bacterium]|nr:hypothetical protein [Spirochaetaceae bacterium]